MFLCVFEVEWTPVAQGRKLLNLRGVGDAQSSRCLGGIEFDDVPVLGRRPVFSVSTVTLTLEPDLC